MESWNFNQTAMTITTCFHAHIEIGQAMSRRHVHRLSNLNLQCLDQLMVVLGILQLHLRGAILEEESRNRNPKRTMDEVADPGGEAASWSRSFP